ncbi:MAG: hypothetical protein IT450_06465 [Phycisphaerales bacterium]|nr:hypothetical protein [Phycisphaerales bacterium]
MHPDRFPGTLDYMGRGRLAFAFLSLLCALLLTGCVDSRRFDATMRGLCFDRLWSELRRYHVDLKVVDAIAPSVEDVRARVAAAETRDAYLVELGRFLDEFQDPHIGFDDLDDYLRFHSGQEPTGLARIRSLDRQGVWVDLDPDVLAAAHGPCAAAAGSSGLVEIADIEGIRSPALVTTFLTMGIPGRPVHVRIRTGDCEDCILECAYPSVDSDADGRGGRRFASVRRFSPSLFYRRPANHKIGYVALRSFDREELVTRFDTALNELIDAPALVIDLRSNVGGEFRYMTQILSRFRAGWTNWGSLHWPLPRVLPFIGPERSWWRVDCWLPNREPVFGRPIVVLVDGATASAAELFALNLREQCGAVLVGQQTLGAHAGVRRVKLPDGLQLQFGSVRLQTHAGTELSREGVTPDVVVPADRQAIRDNGLDELRRIRSTAFTTACETAEKLAQTGEVHPAE